MLKTENIKDFKIGDLVRNQKRYGSPFLLVLEEAMVNMYSGDERIKVVWFGKMGWGNIYHLDNWGSKDWEIFRNEEQ